MKINSLVVVVESLLKRSRAHLARGVAAPHFKVYICGSRNGISILDSDKTLLSLTNALNFIGNLIRTKKARFFLLNTNNIFIYEIMDEMVDFMQKNQWKIGEFLNSCSTSKKHIRSRKINMLLGFQRSAPDCVLILDASIKSSVILEADRAQIPIVSFIDSSTPFLYVNKITYPIPAMKDIKFVYQFCNLVTKTSKKPGSSAAFSSASSGSSSSNDRRGAGIKLILFFMLMVGLNAAVAILIFLVSANLELFAEEITILFSYISLLLSSLLQKEVPLSAPPAGTAIPTLHLEERAASPPLNMERGEGQGRPEQGREGGLPDLNVSAADPEVLHPDTYRQSVDKLTKIITYLQPPSEKEVLFPNYNNRIRVKDNPVVQAAIADFLKQHNHYTFVGKATGLAGLGKKSPLWSEFVEFLLERQRNRGGGVE
jgi:UTP--glucose-1-phosphate uridylyltransferase